MQDSPPIGRMEQIERLKRNHLEESERWQEEVYRKNLKLKQSYYNIVG